MGWGKLDDGWWSHRKTRSASLAASGLKARGISYSSDQESDGWVDEEWVGQQKTPAQRRQGLRELLRSGEFERLEAGEQVTVEIKDRDPRRGQPSTVVVGPHQEPGYLIHDYLEYNPSRAEIEADRAAERQKKASGRSALRQERIPWESRGESTRVSRGDSRGESTRVSLSTRPDPTRPEEANASPPKPPTGASLAESLAEFEDWLAQHEQVTGMRPPKPGTKARAGGASAFAARRSEGYSVDELELAVAGAFADEYRRENGYFGVKSVLRPEMIHDLIEKGRRAQSGFAGQAPTAADRGVTDMLEAARRFQEEDAA